MEIEINMTKGLKKLKNIDIVQSNEKILISQKNLDNKQKSINNDLVNDKDINILKEIGQIINNANISDIRFKNLLFNIVEDNIKDLENKKKEVKIILLRKK